MKTSGKVNLLLTVIAVLFLLGCGAAGVIKNGVFFGKRSFDMIFVIYAAGILLGILYLILFLLLFRKYQLKTHCMFSLITVVMMLPFLVLTSMDSFLDAAQGCIEVKTEIYKLPAMSWQMNHPSVETGIELSLPYHGFYRLPVSMEMYTELTENNPSDETRTVYDAEYDENVHPHVHPVIIRFYEHTKIVDSIQIVYEQ